MSDSPNIDFYGAEWCGDCRRTKRLLDKHGVAYNYLDTANDEAAMMKAVEISGRQSIPVVQFSDGSFFVEPSDPDMEAKLREVGLIS
jgi:glutaredoxin-like protein